MPYSMSIFIYWINHLGLNLPVSKVEFQGLKKETFMIGIDNMIENLKDNTNHKPMYIGYMANISPSRFIEELLELRELIKNEKIEYLSVS